VVLTLACLVLLGAGGAGADEPPGDVSEPVTSTREITPTIPTADQIANQVIKDLAGKPTVLFYWYPDDWGEGGLFFLLGLAGALVTVYLFVGEMLPAMGGRAEYERTRVALDYFVERRNEIIRLRDDVLQGRKEVGKPLTDVAQRQAERQLHLTALNELSDDLQKVTELLEGRLRSERWRLFAVGFPIYLVLGGFFAAAFAQSFLEAVIIGFGWTIVADRLGMKRQEQELELIREKRVVEINAERKHLETEVAAMADQLQVSADEVDNMTRNINRYVKGLHQIQSVAADLLYPLDKNLSLIHEIARKQGVDELGNIADDIEEQISELLTQIQDSMGLTRGGL
jgi:hypothetical protein